MRYPSFARRLAALSLLVSTVAVPATTASACPTDPFCIQPNPPPVMLWPSQLLVNPGFEDTTPQTTPPHPGWIKSENAAFVTNPHHSGVEALEVDTGLWGPPPFGPPQSFAFQQVTIPADAPHPILRYFLDVQTSVTGTSAVDTLTVKIIPPQPNVFPPVFLLPTTLATHSNLNNTHGAWCRKGDFDLSAFRGQTVTLSFTALINSANPAATRFYLDDVELWTSPPLSLATPAC
jgi:hypothetical protein